MTTDRDQHQAEQIDEETRATRAALSRRMYATALRMLARREHGEEELRRKLLAKFSASSRQRARVCFNTPTVADIRSETTAETVGELTGELICELISELIGVLVKEGYLSDCRFVETYVRSRVNRGYGPSFIANELASKGVPQHLIDSALYEFADAWRHLAATVVERRHRDFRKDAKNWGKAVRFLTRRGFASDVVAHVVGIRPPSPSD